MSMGLDGLTHGVSLRGARLGINRPVIDRGRGAFSDEDTDDFAVKQRLTVGRIEIQSQLRGSRLVEGIGDRIVEWLGFDDPFARVARRLDLGGRRGDGLTGFGSSVGNQRRGGRQNDRLIGPHLGPQRGVAIDPLRPHLIDL